jgi:predicted DNA binding CopG/RHH family protein
MSASRKKKVQQGIPSFSNEDEERRYWSKQDSTELIEWSTAEEQALPHLKPSTTTISLRLPELLLDSIRLLANARDVPYQSLMKVFLAERIQQEFALTRHQARPQRSGAGTPWSRGSGAPSADRNVKPK